MITNDALLGTINKSGMRADLDAIVDALGNSGGQQAAGRVNAIGETAKQRALRLALRLNHMQPIASVARAKLRSVPNFQAMTMPSPRAGGTGAQPGPGSNSTAVAQRAGAGDDCAGRPYRTGGGVARITR